MGNLQYLSVFIVVLLTNCEAKQKHVSHSESLNRKYIKHKWMSKLDDSRLLSSISIPGTHRSSKNLKTSKPRFQAWVLQNQMDAGVRFFELHVSTNNIKYGGSEGVEESETFSYFLKTLLTFLAKQDTETLLLKLIPDEGAVAQVTEKLNRKKSDLWMDERIPTLGQVRGKIVLIQSSTLKLGLPIQMTELDGDLNAKEMQMRKNIKLASENCDHDMRLSYTGAKGESEDPLMIAKALNKPVDDYLLDLKGDHTRPHCVGVIAMDFPGPKVIETIINFNGKLGEGSNFANDPGKGDVALPEPQPTPKADEPPTDAPGENPTPKADEPPTDAPGENPTPKADEPPTDAPGENPTPKADEPPTDAPGENPTPKADEPPTDAPGENPTPKADEPQTDAPGENPTPKADEPPTDAPGENPTPKADEPPTDAPGENPTPKADEPPTDAPGENPTPKADEPPTDAPGGNPTPKADEPPTDAPGENPTPKADEPPTDAPGENPTPKADEPPTDAPGGNPTPKADEPPTDAPGENPTPKADEPPTDAPGGNPTPKADEPPTDAPGENPTPKADEPPTDAPGENPTPKADEPQTHPPIVEPPKEKPKHRKVIKIKCRKKHPKRQPSPLLVD